MSASVKTCRELAWDSNIHSAAGVIIYGLHAEALYWWHTGKTAAKSLGGVRLEPMDPLAMYAPAMGENCRGTSAA
ncbi:hypothetical protein [Mycolicibacterium frederiksbergense]|uniref:hypothetical protein n=1 Tax=Mycolicibacterium frederiksbergense TaxID=117567 RepID=UPI0024760C6F|nr:hypothetical protein [Mycolicibacterium frederiksbergense]